MKPALLIMAAGIGSRYGTLKQMDRVGPSGETIIDYSVFDAIRAGFEKVVFIIRRDIENDFKEVVLRKLEGKVNLDYVFQELSSIPPGSLVPADRLKPWGTGHAVLMAADKIKTPFAVINSDDYYGYSSFDMTAKFLSGLQMDDTNTYCLAGYHIKNTLSEHGFVSRGICQISADGYLKTIVERTHVSKTKKDIRYQDEDGNFKLLDEKTIVSMNIWGFTPLLFVYLKKYFNEFIRINAGSISAEFLLPSVIGDLVSKEIIQVKVLDSHEKWFGMTYQEDREKVIHNIRNLVAKGRYPENLWN
ncbi:MAG: sugar phosphate nucleotidyltransferase [Bacteroidetes bacterium]|nr:sugar phosphate nucleotidyltransferase [Bacteroidota bacterium]